LDKKSGQSYVNYGEQQQEEGDDWEIPEEVEEGVKEIRTYDYNYETFKDAEEIQKILDTIKRENIEIKTKDVELKGKFENMKWEYEKLGKERRNLETRQQGTPSFLI
jgi:hypothetical protein